MKGVIRLRREVQGDCCWTVGLVLPRFVVQALCKRSGIESLVCRGVRGQAAERGAWPAVVALLSPEFDPVTGIGH